MIDRGEAGRNAATDALRPPLSARSLALSVLLGSDPPSLPVRALVELGELFGIAPGTTRTALSRMVAAGELEAGDGRYRLVGRLLSRRHAQETGRRVPPGAWDGRWHVVVVRADARSVAERREFRSRMSDHRFGELRPAVWLRPANLAAPADRDGELLVSTGELATADPAGLAGELWDLAGWAATARALVAELSAAVPALEQGGDEEIPPTFLLSAAVLRHLRHDPLLPAPLLPDTWPGDELRRAYDHFDPLFVARLQAFLRRHRQVGITNRAAG